MAMRGEVCDGLSCAVLTIGADEVGVEEARWAIDEDDRRAVLTLGGEVAVIRACRDDNDPVDAPRAERADEVAFPICVFVAVAREYEHPAA